MCMCVHNAYVDRPESKFTVYTMQVVVGCPNSKLDLEKFFLLTDDHRVNLVVVASGGKATCWWQKLITNWPHTVCQLCGHSST